VTGAGLDTKQAATYLGVSERTMQRYLRAYLAGDTSRGFVATKIHTNRGKGYEWRFVFEAGATPDAPAQHDTRALVVPVRSHPANATLAPPEGAELAVLALRALDEVRRENERLRAVVESLRRPLWRKAWEKVRRRS
jgi:hypothetical protein